MNKLASEAKPFVEELHAAMPKTKTCESVLCVPFAIIPAMAKVMRDSRLAFGAPGRSRVAQAPIPAKSAPPCSDLGVKYCIVGHSERREYHGETTRS
ncbi:MAG: triose-phosphate isomerase [Oscillospiraceae bacterium]